MDIDEKIKIFALENAVKFKGKATQGAIIGKVMSLDPSIKNDMKSISQKIKSIIDEVNSLDEETQKKMLQELNPNFEDEKKEKKKANKEREQDLPDLPNAVMGKVVTRIPPEPSKYNHIGHALSFLINYMYAQKYDGKCIMRFEDTNPDKESEEFVEAMKSDCLDYLDIKPSSVKYVSDAISEYYSYAEKLIKDGNAYVCFCPQEEISLGRRNMTDCSCRNKSVAETTKEWDGMKKGTYKEGECVLRTKIDMQHKNAVMRDPVIFRLCYTSHYRQGTKFKVWPMYDFENAVEEHICGITHVLRSNEFESRIELQDHIRHLLGFHDVIYVRQYGRFNITGATTQGREIRELIESGNYIGWDDPRLVTLRALKRRGIAKETFYQMARQCGLSKAQSNIDFTVVSAINRNILDREAKRFFFIEHPVKVVVKGSPKRKLSLEMHPDHDIGKRYFETTEKYILEKSDVDSFKEGEFVRLIDNVNIIYNKSGSAYVSEKYEEFKEKGTKIIHFLVDDEKENVPVEIMMPDTTIVKGIAEKNITTLKVGDIIQFQRFGFSRLDNIVKKDGKSIYEFWFTHR